MNSNKKIRFIAITLILLGIVLIICSIVLNKPNKSNTKKEDQVKITYLNLLDDKVLNLLNLTKNDYSCKSITDYVENDKLLAKDFPVNFVFSKILFDYQNISIEKTNIDNISKVYYGDDYKIQYNKIKDLCIEYDYDENSNIYTIKSNNCTCKRNIVTEIVSAVDYEKYIEIYEYILYKEDESYYSKYEATRKLDINSIDDMTDADYINNFCKYKYTYKLNNNSYYLYSIERAFD